MKEVMLEAMANVLKRKRQERLAEQIKVDAILEKCKFPGKETPQRGYLDNLRHLDAEIKKLEESILATSDIKDI